MNKKDESTRFVRVEFVRFKAFKRFNLSLRHFNILVRIMRANLQFWRPSEF